MQHPAVAALRRTNRAGPQPKAAQDRVRGRGRRALLAAAAATALLPGTAGAATLSATPANLGSVFSSAQSGDTILLAGGTYGRFYGGQKPGPGPVTLRPQSGASATIAASFMSATNITIDGVTISDLVLEGSGTKNITVSNSTFTGRGVVWSAPMSNANVLLDRNTHIGINVCGGCFAGRLHFPERGSQPSGVTVSNSYFAGGSADGIQNGANGLKILNNEFVNLHQGDPNVAHTDPIQLYGSANTVIQGNYIHETASGIMAPDGADHEIIENNVIWPASPQAIQLGSDNGSIVRHNTLPDGACEFNQRCGILAVGSKPGEPGGRGTVIKDNILGAIAMTGGSATYESDHNLIRGFGGIGANDIVGLPTYVSGTAPNSLPGFQLASGSLGWRNASDGANRGIAAIVTPTPPAPAPPPPPAPAPPPAPVASWTYSPSSPQTGQAVKLDASGSTGTGLTCSWAVEGKTLTGCVTQYTFTTVGSRPVTLTVDSTGQTATSTKTIAVWAAPAPTVAGGLVASFGFDEASGATVKDSSGAGNAGTVVGPTRGTGGKHGAALTFDGANDYVTVPDSGSLDLTAAMTLEAWIRPTAGGAGWRQVVLKEGTGDLAYGLYAFDDAGLVAGFVHIGDDVGSPGSKLALNVWSHLATTYDGAKLRTYVNGVLVGQRNVRGAIAVSRSALKIGGNAIWGEFFKGRIDDVRVYNRALTPAQLMSDMNVPA